MNQAPILPVICNSLNHAPFIEPSFSSMVKQTGRHFKKRHHNINPADKNYEIADTIFKNPGLTCQSFTHEKNSCSPVTSICYWHRPGNIQKLFKWQLFF